MTDAELIAAALAGDARGFGALVSRYRDLACAVACAASGDPAGSEDLAQEAFVVAWRRLDSLSDRDRFGPWLCGIVRNVVRAARRHQRRHAPAATEPAERLGQLPDLAPSPLDRAAAREELARAVAALGELPIRYREPLVLYCRLDRSHAQVAASLGMSEQAVRQRLSRARRQLRDRVDEVERAIARTRPRRPLAASVLALIWARHASGAHAASAAMAPPAWLVHAAAPVAAGCAAAVVVIALALTGGAAGAGEAAARAGLAAGGAPGAIAAPGANRPPASPAGPASAPPAHAAASAPEPAPSAVVRLGAGAVRRPAAPKPAATSAAAPAAAAAPTAAPPRRHVAIQHGPAIVTPAGHARPRRARRAPGPAIEPAARGPLLRPSITLSDLDLDP
ncbi:MAG TPA: sigma-70 family RNA polymerase sigma factor [Kofleriaceae bacterium]|nr:sigma-70 family RNA polymerase sigma factor [Kofleriaceae bacterium]